MLKQIKFEFEPGPRGAGQGKNGFDLLGESGRAERQFDVAFQLADPGADFRRRAESPRKRHAIWSLVRQCREKPMARCHLLIHEATGASVGHSSPEAAARRLVQILAGHPRRYQGGVAR